MALSTVSGFSPHQLRRVAGVDMKKSRKKIGIFEDMKRSLEDALAYEQRKESSLRVTVLPNRDCAQHRR
jgi:hypothetical protein